MDVYERLQQHLDRLPIGFPPTESGVQLEILKKLFTPEEAEIACALDVRPETPEKIAARLNMDPNTAKEKLTEMSHKGLVFRRTKDGETVFSGAAFVVGIYEYQVRRMDRRFAEQKARYLKEGFYDELAGGEGKSPFLRVIPVSKSITPELGVFQYEEVRSLIGQQDLIAVTDCICRVKAGLLDHPCDRPKETCFSFGAGAEFYIENGWGRRITHEEAFRLLDVCDQEALVLSPSNAQRPVAICACCSCCCDYLHGLKRFEQPALVAQATFLAEVDPDRCVGCETCVERCQMEAVTMVESVAYVDGDRCIGCGLCVSTCPEEALSLHRRETAVTPPEGMGQLFKKIAAERGKR